MPLFGGSLRDFLDTISGEFRALDGDMQRTPLETETNPSKPMEITPKQAQRDMEMGSDKRNIIDDKGNIVDMDWGSDSSNPFKFGGKKYEQGTMRNFLQRLLSPDAEQGNKSELSGGQPRLEELTGVLNKDQPQPNLQPPPDYRTKTIDPQHIQELRASLYKDAGQGAPPLASVNVDPNSLAGRMQSPNYEAEKKQQMQEGQDTSDRFSLQPRANKKSNTNPFATLFTGRQ